VNTLQAAPHPALPHSISEPSPISHTTWPSPTGCGCGW